MIIIIILVISSSIIVIITIIVVKVEPLIYLIGAKYVCKKIFNIRKSSKEFVKCDKRKILI